MAAPDVGQAGDAGVPLRDLEQQRAPHDPASDIGATPIGRPTSLGSADVAMAPSSSAPYSPASAETPQGTPRSALSSMSSTWFNALGTTRFNALGTTRFNALVTSQASSWFLAAGTAHVHRANNMSRVKSTVKLFLPQGTAQRLKTVLSTMRFLCTPRMRRVLLHRPAALLILIATQYAFITCAHHVASVGISPELSAGDFCKASEPTKRWYLVRLAGNYGLQAVITAFLAAWLLCKLSSWHLRWARLAMVLAWLKAFLNFWYVAFFLSGTGDYKVMLEVLDLLIQAGLFFVNFWLGIRNTRLLERGMMKPLGSRSLKAVACPLVLAFLLLFVFLLQRRPARIVWSSLVWYMVGSMSAIVVLTLRALGVAWLRLATVAQQASLSGPQREEVVAAKRACLVLLLWTVTSILTSVLNLTSRYFTYFSVWPLGDISHVVCKTNLTVDFLDGISNAGVILVSSGVLTGAVQRCYRLEEHETARRMRRLSVVMSGRPSNDQGWDATVQELANRGFTLKALLDFYRNLPTDMPHFDPARSTTKDVVRHAIIPLSCLGRCALATRMMGGVPVLPRVMVTHAWSNKFRDTVAAIVAHALDDSCFEFAARMLEEKLDKLEEMLAWHGVLGNTYWLCAFSVNQHASICESSRGVDTVTGQPYAVCKCGHQKFWNASSPVTGDGRSVRCEMNKFDDMMHYMATIDKNFCQLICLDRELLTLSRCWCVAEVVEAYNSGMHQLIICFSRETLQAHGTDISHLRVEDMQASHPEDVEEILSKIKDKEAFNTNYRSIVRDGLTKWMDLPLQDQIHHAGRSWLHAVC